MKTIDEMLDEVESMPQDDMYLFNDILNNRVKELKRQEFIDSVLQSRKEYDEGKATQGTVDDIMNEILS
jgi:hypothetical protein